MSETTVIVHGWSDCSKSFRDLKRLLVQERIGVVKTILYADYESREDNITFNDVIDGLNDEFIRRGLIDQKGRKRTDLNVVVHSTGGLVIRHWIWRYYAAEGRLRDCPVKRLVMLAPANFGSPLAHRGKSFLGAIFKGRWKIGDLLEVGRNLLNGLELGSSYQWQLAHRDLYVPEPIYTANRVQTTILVGADDYTGLRGWVNKPGTDGTVVISGTSLDSAKLVLDFSKPESKAEEYLPYRWVVTNPPDDFAWAVLQGMDHGSIVDGLAPGTTSQAASLLLRALRTGSPADFRKLRSDLETTTQTTYASTLKPKYQQFLLHAVDDQGEPIRDFTVEFFIRAKDRDVSGNVIKHDRPSQVELELSKRANDLLTSQFHQYSQDSSYRRFLVDLGAIKSLLQSAGVGLGNKFVLSMRIYVPDEDKGIRYRIDNLQNVVLHDSTQRPGQGLSFFYENTTTLVELRVDRFNSYVRVGEEPRKH